MAYARRTDENHSEIRKGLRKLGYDVKDFSGVGNGIPDLSVRISPTMSVWLEVKKDSKEPLTAKEEVFKFLWFDCYRVVTSVDEAVAAIEHTKIKFKEL